MKKIFVLSVLMSVSSFIYAASVTIYNDNFALVKDTKEVSVKNGQQMIEIDDVSAKIDPTSVLPKFLSDSDKIAILEQNYDFDLVNSSKLLQKYIGKDITVERYLPNSQKEKISGKLLSVQGGTIIKTNNDKIVINPEGEISLPKMPEGLMLKPTLSWLINSKVSGKKKLELTYKTTGFSWVADYVAVLDKDDKKIDLNAWVTINNTSGATYKDAKLKLVAGDVNTVKEYGRSNRVMLAAKSAAMDAMAEEAAGFQEQSFFEYHIYKLQRTANLKDNEKKQIEFTAAQNVPVEKKYTYESSKNNKVEISLKFKNNKNSNLGIPLPKGKVRVFKSDGDSIEFVGEDIIDHTPENKDMKLTIGNAFDVTAEKKMTNSTRNNSAKQSEETYEIILKNAKAESVKVEVIEKFYSNWKIVSNSQKFEKKDANTAVFEVEIPAKSEKKVTYKVKYSW